MALTRQRERVLSYLKENGSITPSEAFENLGVYRLSAVIFMLRDDGYQIDTDIEKSVNRFGNKVHYARYIYGGKNEEIHDFGYAPEP